MNQLWGGPACKRLRTPALSNQRSLESLLSAGIPEDFEEDFAFNIQEADLAELADVHRVLFLGD